MSAPTGVRASAPVVGPAIEKRLRAHPRPTAVAHRLRASDALRCARRLGFGVFGVVPDISYTDAEKARFSEGDFVDVIAGEVLVRQVNARTQIPFSWLPELSLGGKADAGYRMPPGEPPAKVIVEVKSAAETKWSRVVGLWNNVPPGPDPEWLVQAGLAALSPAVQAEFVHIIVVDKERFDAAEWVIGVDDPLDGPDYPPALDAETGEIGPATVRSMVMAEVARMGDVLAECDEGVLPARVIPGCGLVDVPPARGDDRPTPWQCAYCPFQPTCSTFDPGPVAGYFPGSAFVEAVGS